MKYLKWNYSRNLNYLEEKPAPPQQRLHPSLEKFKNEVTLEMVI